MGRALPEVDASVHWSCPTCRYKHRPGSACPPVGVWLVLTLCLLCDAKTGRYCHRHRDRAARQVIPTQIEDPQ